jgi:hypothetical protein
MLEAIMSIEAATCPSFNETDAVRYHITDDLWNSFSVEQVRKQYTRLKETGRFEWPNPGMHVTVRVSYYALVGGTQIADELAQGGIPVLPNGHNTQTFYDFHFQVDNDRVTFDITQHIRLRRAGVPLDRTQEALVQHADAICAWDKSRLPFDVILKKWRDRDWLCFDVKPTDEEKAEWDRCGVLSQAHIMLAILLHDRATNKVLVQPRPPSKLYRLGIGKKRPPMLDETPEIVLHIPRRVYTGKHGGTHLPPRMHYRAEHVRQQPYGPRDASLRKEVVIEGTWVNFDPAQAGTPIKRQRSYKLAA